jgi:hypothetical protein
MDLGANVSIVEVHGSLEMRNDAIGNGRTKKYGMN